MLCSRPTSLKRRAPNDLLSHRSRSPPAQRVRSPASFVARLSKTRLHQQPAGEEVDRGVEERAHVERPAVAEQ